MNEDFVNGDIPYSLKQREIVNMRLNSGYFSPAQMDAFDAFPARMLNRVETIEQTRNRALIESYERTYRGSSSEAVSAQEKAIRANSPVESVQQLRDRVGSVKARAEASSAYDRPDSFSQPQTRYAQEKARQYAAQEALANASRDLNKRSVTASIRDANAMPPVEPIPINPRNAIARQIGTSVGQIGAGLAGDYIGDRASEAVFGSSNGFFSNAGTVVGGIAGTVLGGVWSGGLGSVAGSFIGSSIGSLAGSLIDNLLGWNKPKISDRAADLGKNGGVSLPSTATFTGGQSVATPYCLLFGCVYTENTTDYELQFAVNRPFRFVAFGQSYSPDEIRSTMSFAGAISASELTSRVQGLGETIIEFRGVFVASFGAPLKNVRILSALTANGSPDIGGAAPNPIRNPDAPFIPSNPIPNYPLDNVYVNRYVFDVLPKSEEYESGVVQREKAPNPPVIKLSDEEPITRSSLPKAPRQVEANPINNPINNTVVINSDTARPQKAASEVTRTNQSPVDVWDKAKEDFDKYYKVGYGMFNTSGVKGFVAGVNSSFGSKPSSSNGGVQFLPKSTAPTVTTPYGTPVTPPTITKPPDIAKPRETTSTPISDDHSTAKILGATAAIAATVGLLKIGSDALVNTSLATTPKINTILDQTSAPNQQTNAATGACTALNSATCTTGLKDSIVNPINQNANANQALNNANNAVNDAAIKGIAANQVGQNTALAGITSTLGTVAKFVGSLYNNQFVQSSINYLTLATTIHNATMLTRDIGETLGEVVDNGLTLAGRQFQDKEGGQVQFSEYVGANAKALISGLIGAENYAQMTLKWQKASAIFNSAANVVNTTQSMLDPLSSAVEYGMENVSKIGNNLKKDGVVSENAYPVMDETIRARRTSRFAKLTDALEGSENIVSNLSSVTSDAVSVKEDLKQLREDKKALTDSAAAFNTVKQEELATIKASIPVMTEISLAPAPDTD